MCSGCFSTEVMTEKGDKGTMTIYVLRSNTDNLLSREAATKFGFVKRLDSVFGEMGQIKCDPVKIILQDDAQPYV